MRLHETIHAYGTSEGVSKAWDERGRGRNEQSGGAIAESIRQAFKSKPSSESRDPLNTEECIGPNCRQPEVQLPKGDEKTPPIVVPHLDHIELQMTSNKSGQNIHFGREQLKTMLRMALVQLDAEDNKIQYLNTNQADKTDHYATIAFDRRDKGITGAGEK